MKAMCRIMVAVLVGIVFAAGSAGAQGLKGQMVGTVVSPLGNEADAKKVDDSDLTTVQPSRSNTILAKIKLRRVCPAGQTRCACADTGTSACCTENQRCVCAPVAHCH